VSSDATTREETAREDLYGCLAEFESADDLLAAVKAVRAANYRCMEAYTPHPIERVSHELGHKNHLPLIVFIGGLLGALSGFGLQYYASVLSYPVKVGGKPLNSWPSFIVVTFELTILFAAGAAVLGMFALNKLPQPYHPVFNAPIFELASRNRYFLLIEAADPAFDPVRTPDLLRGLTQLQIVDVPR
jgi:Alternative complex III, ActD subunit